METIGFSMYNITPSVNNDSFTSSFLIWMPFISSYLIAVTRTSSSMLNKRGKCSYSCVVHNVKGNTCSFCLLSMMLAVGLSYMVFIMFRYVPSILTLEQQYFINTKRTVEKILFFLNFVGLFSTVYTFEIF